jgi:hypothetical protein
MTGEPRPVDPSGDVEEHLVHEVHADIRGAHADDLVARMSGGELEAGTEGRGIVVVGGHHELHRSPAAGDEVVEVLGCKELGVRRCFDHSPASKQIPA